MLDNIGGSLLATLLAHTTVDFSHWAFPVPETDFGRHFVLAFPYLSPWAVW